MSGDVRERIAARYERFADLEARGRSPLYQRLGRAVAVDPEILDLLAAMPELKRQPNLLLGAVRYRYGTPRDAEQFIELVHAHSTEVAGLMMERSTQTNEPARCATLLPVLARLPQPLALLEVGASAGLCLLPDRYAYDHGTTTVAPGVEGATQPPVFACRANAATPLPERNVEVVWRAGLDLHPIDLADEAEVRWLEALVRPGEEYRVPLLRRACAIGRADPPRVVAGDLRSDLASLAREAPPEATLVVFHTAVLGYVPGAEDRAAFASEVAELGAVWIANEWPRVIPGVAEHVLRERPPADDFLLCLDGRPTAWADGHGTWIDWRRS